MGRILHGAGVCAAIAASLASCPAYAAELQTLDRGWPPGWSRFGAAETAALGLVGAGVVLLEFFVAPPSTPNWDKPVLFDDAARNALRAGSVSGRSRAAIASDVGYFGLPIYAVGVEAGLMTWLGRGQGDAALQLALINLEVIAVNGLLTRVTQRGVGRARPDHVDPADNTSFFSGHTSVAFSMASAICVQHSRIEIYGGIADKVVCPAALTAATATGLLRIVADRHFASDVLAGAILGSLVGATISWLHLRGEGRAPASLSLAPADRALVYTGSF